VNKNRWAKRKGTIGERDLVDLFWTNLWSAHRIAGSGSNKYPSPDVIAGNGHRKMAIECKVTSDKKKYFTKDEIVALKDFASIFGAEAWVAVKFNKMENKDWYFFNLEDLNETDKTYNISYDECVMKGLLFEEVIK